MVTHRYNRAYNELYLNNAMMTLATMLDYAVNFEHEDIDNIFKRFINSNCCTAFEKGDPATIAGKSGVELYSLITEKYINLPSYFSFNRSPEYWLGWSLAYYQWYTIKSFHDIHQQISLNEMLTWYYTLHEADVSRFVDTLNSRLYVKQTNLEYLRKRVGLTQKSLSQLSGVPQRSIQLYEQRQHDISKAQFNILYALSRVLNCSVYDLSEHNQSMKPINSQYSQDSFINQLTNKIEGNNRRIAQFQAERAQLALRQQGYAFGYVGQFPYQQLQFINQDYQIPTKTYISNWINYWTPIMEQLTKAKEIEEKKKQIAKIGIEAIGEIAKHTNQSLLSMTADVVGIITADSLANAIYKILSLIYTPTKI